MMMPNIAYAGAPSVSSIIGIYLTSEPIDIYIARKIVIKDTINEMTTNI
ncbi:hypothetical protein [Aeribacillus pallidus]|nr:hypothetical protein [Aeribacillus pallidus]